MAEKVHRTHASHEAESASPQIESQITANEFTPEVELEPRARTLMSLQHTIGNQAVQRLLNRSQASANPTDDLAQQIRAASSGGTTLDAATRERLQASLGVDLSGVRIHRDDEADQLAESVEAVAFTTGNDIFFRNGMYQPETTSGFRLLAHEVTHTVQQSIGPVAGTLAVNGVSISDPSDQYEQAAEHAADQVMGGLADVNNAPTILAAAGPVQRMVVQRQDEDAWASMAAMISPLASTLVPGLGGAATLPINAASALEAGALPGTAAYDAVATAIDAGAASDFVAAWGGPEALMAAASQGVGTAAADVAGAGAVDTALATAATLPADAMAAMGSAATVPELGALATLPETAMTGLATALPGTAEYASLAGAIDSSAAADFVAAWGGPEALMAAAGGGGEAAAAGGVEALAGGALAGEAGAGLGAAALPVAAVIGSAAAGAAAGYGLDQLSNYVGQKITGNEKGDYHISTGIGNAMTAVDQGLTSLWADPSKPEYTQTLGWKLANWLD